MKHERFTRAVDWRYGCLGFAIDTQGLRRVDVNICDAEEIMI
jgi:hypothetical protein